MTSALDDKRDAGYWRAVKPDTTITLTDDQALRESVSGQNYIVKEVMHIRELTGICEWIFLKLEGLEDAPSSWLMVKIVDQELDLRVYFEDPDSFETGNREDMVANETLWVFQEPDDEEYEYGDLKYAQHVGWDFPGDEDGDPDGEIVTHQNCDIHVDYNIKGGGEMQGKVTFDPRCSGQEDYIATIVEYDTSDETTCPEMMFIEVGDADIDEGGLIRLMFGNSIRPTEAEVLAVT